MTSSINRVSCVVASLLVGACLHTPPGPVVAERPGFGYTPGVLEAGAIQLESGFTSDRAHGTTYQAAGESLLRIGIGGGAEFRVAGNSYAIVTNGTAPRLRGMEDSKLGMKVSLNAVPDSVHSIVPSLAVLFASTLPTGAKNIGTGVSLPEGQLTASWSTSTPWSFGTTVGVGAAFDGRAWSNPGWATGTVSYQLTHALGLFAQTTRQFDVRGPVAPATLADGGLTLMLGERLQIDARMGRGLSAAEGGERFFGFGIARRF